MIYVTKSVEKIKVEKTLSRKLLFRVLFSHRDVKLFHCRALEYENFTGLTGPFSTADLLFTLPTFRQR